MDHQNENGNNLCVIVPTYNNAGTVGEVVSEVYRYCKDVIVVNDGSTDQTSEILASLDIPVTVVSYGQNKGKGHALVTGFRKASSMGYSHAITIDADGQHYPSDIPLFMKTMDSYQNGIIVGSRNLNEENMPRKNTFANRFSNFWFRLQTGIDLPDTQSGFRLYTLSSLHGLGFITSRYESELELLVFAAWAGEPVTSLPIRVYYPPADKRVSHYRPTYDFVRISILNTVLCVGAVVYGWPMKIFRHIAKVLR